MVYCFFCFLTFRLRLWQVSSEDWLLCCCLECTGSPFFDSYGLRPKKFLYSVAVRPAPVRFLAKGHFPGCHVSYVCHDNGDKEMIPAAMQRYPDICQQYDKTTAMSLRQPLSCHFQRALKFQHFPDLWKKSNMITIPKPGEDPKMPQTRLPISLLNCLRKI